MPSLPLKIGDAHGVVVEIALDRDGLEWLAYKCPEGDEFTKELRRALDTVDEELESTEVTPRLYIYVGGVLRD